MSDTINIAEDIRSLTDFKRHTTELTDHIKETGRPMVLTVNGRAELVVQDAVSYQAMLKAVDELATIEGLRRALSQKAKGKGRPATEVFAEFNKRHGISDGD